MYNFLFCNYHPMAEKEWSVLEWCGKGFVATVCVSGGYRLRLELPAYYVLQHKERRADGTQVLSFGIPWNSLQLIPEVEDPLGSEAVVQGRYGDEEANSPSVSSADDSRGLKLKVANNYKVKFPKSSQEPQGPE